MVVKIMSLEKALTKLQVELGKHSQIEKWVEMTQERINQFAEVTGDYQWIHNDTEKAKKYSPFKSTIAHGFLTLSLIPYLTGIAYDDASTLQGVKQYINYGLNKVRFICPVKPGDQIRTRSKLISAIAVKGGIKIKRKITVEIKGVKRPACVAEIIILALF